MDDHQENTSQKLLDSLMERAKELNTLYRLEELLSDPEKSLEEVFAGVIAAIPAGLQYPEMCCARITYGDLTYESDGFSGASGGLGAAIVVRGTKVGEVCVSYQEEMPPAHEGPFLKEEVQLLRTIATRLGDRILHHRLRQMFRAHTGVKVEGGPLSAGEWRVALDMLRKIDANLLARISRKMMNLMVMRGIPEAHSLLLRYRQELRSDSALDEANEPLEKASLDTLAELCEETFAVAAAHLPDSEILSRIQKWVHEDRSKFLTRAVSTSNTPLNELADSVKRYLHLFPEGTELPPAADVSVRVELIRRMLSEQLDFINVAKRYLKVEDFAEILGTAVFTSASPGRLGGKSSGLILAGKILEQAKRSNPDIGDLRIPRAWYITSDAQVSFINSNNLEELYEQKYKDIAEIRQDYSHIVQLLKNSDFPQEIVNGLSMALDDLGDVPLIVRSSSLLEDRLAHPFCGKYKSLFVANKGTKRERLEAVMDAITEVYASVFSPDAIEYRVAHGLLDFNEEMGILIQQVVGRQVGRYWLPAFAGVAFSNNEMRWSPRIRREDGLLRLVPGLGTRAVDRLTDDYPIRIAVGQPQLKVNISADEVIRYSPQKIDVIDLEAKRFETKDLRQLLGEIRNEFPAFKRIFSVHRDGAISEPVGLGLDIAREDLVATFDGVIGRTPLILQVGAILKELKRALGTPVDIELAHDGAHLFLLQCRPQTRSDDVAAAVIPKDVPTQDIVFTASRYVSNGRLPDLTHVVYVDPLKYAKISSAADLRRIGTTVGALNKVLPKRKFVLMGPGRWGSRGDIKLGVRVTYSDIYNTSLLIEVARKEGNYVPDVSFGTHFFQDLIDSSIRYLPLYPDDDGVVFNEDFLLGSPNLLASLLPEHASLATIIRVIDVPGTTGGKVLRVLLNADECKALAYLADPAIPAEYETGTGGARTDASDVFDDTLALGSPR